MTNFLDRVASAPISWGICEVPGWGAKLPTDRVLREMSNLGITATEYGAPGFLPETPDSVREILEHYDMALIGAFVPLVLHTRGGRQAALAETRRVAAFLSQAGATEFVSCAIMDAGWSVPRQLQPDERTNLLEMFAMVDEVCGEFGLQQVVHPHVQTVIETADDIQWVLGECDVNWCLDTGHLSLGGADPVSFARQAADRVGHVHLKDVNMSLAPALLRREISIMQGVQLGLFPSLGQGDVAIAEVVVELEKAGYEGWYVIEQDSAITGPLPDAGTGPVTEVSRSLSYLREVVAPLVRPQTDAGPLAAEVFSPPRSDGSH